jgi:thioester reductase-like protein
LSALGQLESGNSQPPRRLSFITTDITKPTQDWNYVFNVDDIIFNAWSANWRTPLESFGPLLNAVRNIIEICATSPRRPRIIFMSSTCAIGDWPQMHPEQPLLPEEPAWDIASATENGYGQSKCIAEQLLADAHKQHGLRVAIVRAGLIGGPSTGVGSLSWPIQGSLYVVIRTSQKLGTWPTKVNALDWIPVDALAKGIVEITATDPSSRALCVYNMLHPDPAPWALLYTTLKNGFELSAKQVSLPVWLDSLTPETFKMHAFYRRAGMGREQVGKAFQNQNALRLLPKVDRITEQQLRMWLQGWGLALDKIGSRL